MDCIYRGDEAKDLITINFSNEQGYTIKKLYTTCGKITHIYPNPIFPFNESYSSEETAQMENVNTFYAGVETAELGNLTFNGSIKFRTCPKVIDWGHNE